MAAVRTYYRDRRVHVTSRSICVDDCEFPLSDIEDTWRRGGSLAGRRVMIGLGVVAGALLFRGVWSYAWWFGHLGRQVRRWATGGALALALLAVGVITVAVLSVFAFEALLLGVEHVRGHGRYRELWANVRGADVLLFRTSDAARFEQVCRALSRALGDRLTGRP